MNGSDSTAFIILISILCFILSFLLSIVLFKRIFRDKLVAQKRIMSFFKKETQKETLQPKLKKRKRIFGKKIKLSQTIATELQTAGVLIRVEEYAIIWLFLSFVPSGLIALVTGNAGISVLFAIVGIILPPMYIKKQKKKRIAAFENQLGDALVTMCNCLRSGLTLGQAFENITTEMSEPISKEFGRVCTEMKYGSPLDKSLNSMADRIRSDDLMLTVTAINIQRQVGGNLSEILSSISETIKARVKLKGDIKVMTASGRASGLIIGFLPIALGLMIFLLNPDYMISFVESSIGKVLLGIGVVMECLGFMMIKKILAIKY
ncbi:MAG: hypothetical protein A2Y15_09845 [Clostridiales bacterium GWF2_36_10]|nr:MAG: hypothetical protein A2Y15_09845 [Clostridiales bacterium GWF2_36_10]HAN20193.1 hypothetical protein [Clostridiales bacterium]